MTECGVWLRCLYCGSPLLPVNDITIWLDHLLLGQMTHLCLSSWLSVCGGALSHHRPRCRSLQSAAIVRRQRAHPHLLSSLSYLSVFLSFCTPPPLCVIIQHNYLESSVKGNSLTCPVAACLASRAAVLLLGTLFRLKCIKPQLTIPHHKCLIYYCLTILF